MAIEFPDLDPRDEDQVVADVIDDLPAELSDRNRAVPEIKMIEAVGAFYAAVLFFLNQWTDRLQLAVLNLLGIEQRQAEQATATLTFTRTTSVGALVVPAGTLVKDGIDFDAVKFTTDADLLIQDGNLTGDVSATAVEAALAGNVNAGTLVFLDQPVGGIASVTNAAGASGGLDIEPVAAVIARAPLAVRSLERAITAEDFVFHALNVNGVSRAQAVGSGGNVAVYILATDLNEVPNATLQTDVRTDLLARTTPGVGVTVVQPSLRFVAFPDIELRLDDGAALSDVLTAVVERLGQVITAVDIFAADGYTVEHPAWEYGERLYANELVAALDQVEGVRRVGSITYEYSDDYGSSYTAPAVLTEQAAGFNGLDSDLLGLFQFDATRPLNITVLT